ncbi:DUF411 domain-containing protein [Zoogloea sp.]|uniref:DUF411 domain-containing protein n=1 Tax=Zoogloea sp. TaxID=49181 RepID=UPI0035B25AFA
MKKQALILASALGLMAGSALAAAQVDVYKSPYCGCCGKWVEHLRAQGFDVKTHDVADVPGQRRKLGMPEAYGSCHTAKVGNYLIEGHVPAADVQRLLREKPRAIGLAVPSMPPGSPGMESARPVPYETLLVNADGSSRVFARH